MSALPPKADMCAATRDVRFGSKADICSAKSHESHVRFTPGSGHLQCTVACPLWAIADIATLFDHRIRAADQLSWYIDSKRFCGLEIDDQLDLRGLLDGEFSRLLAFENATDVDTELTERFC